MISVYQNIEKAREEIVNSKNSLALKMLCSQDLANAFSYNGGILMHSGTEVTVIGYIADELIAYLKMLPAPLGILCECSLGQQLLNHIDGKYETGSIMGYKSSFKGNPVKNSSPSFSQMELAKLITSCDSIKMEFDEFYVQLSESIRRGYTVPYVEIVGGEIASCALVKSCDSGVFITGVCTKESHRGQGYAGGLINKITADFGGSNIVLLSKNSRADKLYNQHGFNVIGSFMKIGVDE